MRLQRQKNKQYMITVPSAIVKALRWKKSDKLMWILIDNNLKLIKYKK